MTPTGNRLMESSWNNTDCLMIYGAVAHKFALVFPTTSVFFQEVWKLTGFTPPSSSLRLDPSTSSMVSGRDLLAVSGSSRVRTAPSRGQRPHRTMGACGLMLLRRYSMGARTPPVRAHMEPIPIPFCLWVTVEWEDKESQNLHILIDSAESLVFKQFSGDQNNIWPIGLLIFISKKTDRC